MPPKQPIRTCLASLRGGARTPIHPFASRAGAQARSASNGSKLHPAIVSRARALAAEHAIVSAELAQDYSAKLASRVSFLGPVSSALRELDDAQASIAELQTMASSSDEELRALAAEELSATSAAVGKLTRRLEMALTPKPQYAEMPCLMEIQPGPGGVEGRFFADSLYRMYKSYLAKQGIAHQTVKYELAADGGTGNDGESALLEAIIEVTSEGAYGRFRTEAGMHRVQRVPATEKQGRVHTSAAAVWVLPSFPEHASAETEASLDDPTSDFYLSPLEVKVESMRARGAGGQNVNKTESAVRLTHVPTGTTVSMQDHRSKTKNSEAAWRLLRARVAMQRREARDEQAARLRDDVLSRNRITRGDKVRTYNFPQDRCTDHRSGVTLHNLPAIMLGGDGLDRVMTSVASWIVEKEVADMVRDEEAKAAKEDADVAKPSKPVKSKSK